MIPDKKMFSKELWKSLEESLSVSGVEMSEGITRLDKGVLTTEMIKENSQPHEVQDLRHTKIKL